MDFYRNHRAKLDGELHGWQEVDKTGSTSVDTVSMSVHRNHDPLTGQAQSASWFVLVK